MPLPGGVSDLCRRGAYHQKESGGNLAEVLEKVAYTVRERFRLRKQIMVHTAQGRLTGWILSIFPLVIGIGMYLVNPEGMSVCLDWGDRTEAALYRNGDDRSGLPDYQKNCAYSGLTYVCADPHFPFDVCTDGHCRLSDGLPAHHSAPPG